MDRFFSKLDLREIKIDPERSRFSPDDESEEQPTLVDSEADGHDQVIDAYALDAVDADPSPGPWVDIAVADQVGNAHSTDTAVLDRTSDSPASDVLKVSSKSRPSAVAGAIAGVVRELGRAEVQAIGAGATNQAIKAVAIARDYLHETGPTQLVLGRAML